MTAVPAQIDASPAEPIRRREHVHGHAPDHAHDVHDHASDAPAPVHGHPHHHHAHGPGRRHPAARPGLSLLRLAVWQRLALVLPLAALIWALALAVIWGGNA